MNLQPEQSNEADINSALYKTIAVVGEQSTINANRVMADAKRSNDSLALESLMLRMEQASEAEIGFLLATPAAKKLQNLFLNTVNSTKTIWNESPPSISAGTGSNPSNTEENALDSSRILDQLQLLSPSTEQVKLYDQPINLSRAHQKDNPPPSDHDPSDSSDSNGEFIPKNQKPLSSNLKRRKSDKFRKEMMAKSFELISALDIEVAEHKPQLAVHFIRSIRRWGGRFQLSDADLVYSLEDKSADSEANRIWIHFLDSTGARPSTVADWEDVIFERCEVTQMQNRNRLKLNALTMRDNQKLGDYISTYLRRNK